MDKENKKKIAAEKAISLIPKNEIIGIGTGTTVNHLISVLAHSDVRHDIKGVVTTSKLSKDLLEKAGFEVIDANQVISIPIYLDSADQINHSLQMLKGGGGALLAEKIVANLADNFVCMVDDSKYVKNLSNFPVAVEVIPSARSKVARELLRLGGQSELRINYLTENGNEILDVSNLDLSLPAKMENTINNIVGVVENGIFANTAANYLVLATDNNVEIKKVG